MTARITVLCDSYQGKRLNSPNDVVVKSDGSIWFTDPPFGMLRLLRGREGRVRNCRPPSIASTARPAQSPMVADDVEGPNGLAFSPDESKPVRGRLARHAEPAAPRVRRRGRRDEAWRTTGCSSTPARERRTASASISTAICGAAGAWATRNWTVCGSSIRDRRADRPYRVAGTLRQSLLRRALAQPAVHGREPRAVCAVREHAGCDRRLALRVCSTSASRALRSAPRCWPDSPRT